MSCVSRNCWRRPNALSLHRRCADPLRASFVHHARGLIGEAWKIAARYELDSRSDGQALAETIGQTRGDAADVVDQARVVLQAYVQRLRWRFVPHDLIL